MRKFLIVLGCLFVFGVSSAQELKWEVDTVFSDITFKVNHLIFSTVKGEFFGFDGIAYSDVADFSDVKITFVVYPKSIGTGNPVRDEELQSKKYFDADYHQTIVFSSKKVTSVSLNNYVITGSLNMLGKSKDIELNLEYKGNKQDMHQREVADFVITGQILASEWGMKETPFVSDKVKVFGEIRLVKKGYSY